MTNHAAPALTVAFTGHRRPMAAPGPLAEALGTAFGMIVRACAPKAGAARPPALHLVSGIAPGADRLAVVAARASGFARVTALVPYATAGGGLTDRAGEAGPDDLVSADLLAGLGVDIVEVLDGAGADAAGRDGHAELAGHLLARADLLVALWNGLPPAGPGGTGDVVRMACKAGTPVLWLVDGAAMGLRLLKSGDRPDLDGAHTVDEAGLRAVLACPLRIRQPVVASSREHT